jgi:hypothetical protein
LNFDEILNYPRNKQLKKMQEIIEVIENQEMPLASYSLIHRDAILTENQRTEIIIWAKKTKNVIEIDPNGK